MVTSDKIFLTCVFLYLSLGVFTFGHAWNEYECKYEFGCLGDTALSSLTASIFSPLYWSVQLQKD